MPVRACAGAGWWSVQGCREIDPFSAQAGRGDDGAPQGARGVGAAPEDVHENAAQASLSGVQENSRGIVRVSYAAFRRAACAVNRYASAPAQASR